MITAVMSVHWLVTACKSAWQVRDRECANGRCAVLRSSPILAVPAPGGCGGRMGGGRTSTSIQVFNEKMHFKKVDLEMGGTTQAPDKKGRSGSATLSLYTILYSLY